MRRATRLLFVLALAGSVPAWIAPGRAESKPSPQLAPLNAPKSEFSFRPGFTKDPFYPKSTDVVAPVAVASRSVTTQPSVPDNIVLKGLSISNGRKFAIINYQTVSENEEFSLKRGGKPVTVRCVEIKAQSVMISVDGTTKELFLRAP